jgi:hypothetical protein
VPHRKKQLVKIVRPQQSATRDEGRAHFIPPEELKTTDSNLHRYMQLADIALKNSRRTEEAR